MKDSVFFDTNILVYAHTDLDTVKQSVAQKQIGVSRTYISTQVELHFFDADSGATDFCLLAMRAEESRSF